MKLLSVQPLVNLNKVKFRLFKIGGELDKSY